MKLLEDNVEEYINNLGRKGFLDRIQKAVAVKKKISKFNYVKLTIIIFSSSKEITSSFERGEKKAVSYRMEEGICNTES